MFIVFFWCEKENELLRFVESYIQNYSFVTFETV
jgi:hypothetical protein